MQTLIVIIFAANAIAWGGLGPQMFGAGSTYQMVPISLAIGVFLPFPFYFLVRLSSPDLNIITLTLETMV